MKIDLKKQLAAKLKQMSPNLTMQDKEVAAKEKTVHINTINNYLSGSIGNVDFAISLVEFFTERINQKLDRLNQLQGAA